MTTSKRFHHHLPLATIATASLLLVATACGSSSDGQDAATTSRSAASAVETTASTSSSDELSEDEWREQANAICADTAPAIGEAFGAMDPASPTDAQVDHVVQTLVDVNRETEERIDALAEPSTLAAQVKALLDANEAVTATIEEQGPAVLDTVDQLFAPVNELATELGLDACAG